MNYPFNNLQLNESCFSRLITITAYYVCYGCFKVDIFQIFPTFFLYLLMGFLKNIFTGKSRETWSWRSGCSHYYFPMSTTALTCCVYTYNPSLQNYYSSTHLNWWWIGGWGYKLKKLKRDLWGKHPKMPLIENIYYSYRCYFFFSFFTVENICIWQMFQFFFPKSEGY